MINNTVILNTVLATCLQNNNFSKHRDNIKEKPKRKNKSGNISYDTQSRVFTLLPSKLEDLDF